MYPNLEKLCLTVQKNCHISDALHAGDDTLCVYLLKMREFYRWEQKQPFSASLDNSQVGVWLKEREALWNEIEDQDFDKIEIADKYFDPFDSKAINSHLLAHNLVYSGGLGRLKKPHFFLAELVRHEEHRDYRVLVSDKEFARDLSAPPAMTQGRTIYIRRESLQRLLWQKIEEWRWNEPDNAMGRAMRCYDFENEPLVALEQMTDNELEAMLLHEMGEISVGEQLGEGWEDLLIGQRSRMEIMLRAVRDHYADTISTLPRLLETENQASLHFYFANLNSMRKYLSPSLFIAYESWFKEANIKPLKKLASQAKPHWQQTCENILSLAENRTPSMTEDIINLIENNRL
ncbi:MAG: hypothetical protein OQK73_03550 [Gammaproteobacteria bacterium]|nr:hypothetical protein [Gammaproteobacteria bacterium]